MRFPSKSPEFALVEFLERLVENLIKGSDDHSLPRSRTFARSIFILPVALQLHMNTWSFERQEYKGILCINDRKTDKSSKNRLVSRKLSHLTLDKRNKLTKSQCKTPVSVLRKIIH